MSRSAAVTPASRWPSVRAIAARFLVTVVLSATVDEILHLADAYPPWGNPMRVRRLVVAQALGLVRLS